MSNSILYEKSLAKVIIFGILTLGIYSIWFSYAYHCDTDVLCEGDGKEGPSYLMVWLLSFATLGIYSFIWIYNLGNRLQDNSDRYGVKIREDGTALLIWSLLFPIMASYFMISNQNAMIRAYNEKLKLSDPKANEQTTYAPPPPLYIK